MSGERRRIEDPLPIDFGDQAVPPLRVLFQGSSYVPAGTLEHQPPWVVVGHTPWYREVVLTLSDEAGTAVLYLIPINEETTLLAACLGDAFEPFFELLTGADFGDAVTILTAQHWPEVYSMLVRANGAAAPGTSMLLPVITQRQRRWVVADALHTPELERIPFEHMVKIIDLSVQTLARLDNVGVELPGVIQSLGGPDQASRRLKATSDLIGAGSTIGGILDGGIDGDELVKLAKAARRALSSMVSLRD
jgi:hypothetical protein